MYYFRGPAGGGASMDFFAGPAGGGASMDFFRGGPGASMDFSQSGDDCTILLHFTMVSGAKLPAK